MGEGSKLGKRDECASSPHRRRGKEDKPVKQHDYGEVVSCLDPIQLMLGEWSVATSSNPWASSRSMEQPLKSQSCVYWSEPEEAPH